MPSTDRKYKTMMARSTPESFSRCEGAAGQEEIFASLRILLQVEADAEHRQKIQNNDGEIDAGKFQQMRGSGLQEESWREGISCNRLHLLIVGTCPVNVKRSAARTKRT